MADGRSGQRPDCLRPWRVALDGVESEAVILLIGREYEVGTYLFDTN